MSNQIKRGSLHDYKYYFTYDSSKISLHYVPQEHSKLGRKKKRKNIHEAYSLCGVLLLHFNTTVD